MNNTEDLTADYLGDGVYASFDGYGIWLRANDFRNPTDRIYLEPGVFAALVRYKKRIEELAENGPQE
jgi:hypothetical protein